MKHLIYILTIFLVTISCAKDIELRIEGQWWLDNVGQPGVPLNARWHFYADGTVRVVNDIAITAKEEVTLVGKWKAKRKIGKSYIEVSELAAINTANTTNSFGLNGLWRIENLQDNILALVRTQAEDGGTLAVYMRREFYREKRY